MRRRAKFVMDVRGLCLSQGHVEALLSLGLASGEAPDGRVELLQNVCGGEEEESGVRGQGSAKRQCHHSSLLLLIYILQGWEGAKLKNKFYCTSVWFFWVFF